MVEFAAGWRLDVEPTPEWLFLVIHRSGPSVDLMPELAEQVWQIAEQHGVFQLVIEFAAGVHLSSHLVGQLVLLQKRVCQNGGKLRLCGLLQDNDLVLRDERCPAASLIPDTRGRGVGPRELRATRWSRWTKAWDG